MTITQIILAIFLSFPQPKVEALGGPLYESAEERENRLLIAAEALADATDHIKSPQFRRELILQEIAIMEGESRMARYVGNGDCTNKHAPHKCDADRHGVPRAVSYPQVWPWCKDAHSLPAGSYDQVKAAIRCSLLRTVAANRKCASHKKGQLYGVFAGHRTFIGCTVDERKSFDEKVALYNRAARLFAQLERKESEQ